MMMSSTYRNIINLGNSIIGVSILAMPYCFKKCGIALSLVVILASGLVTRVACHLLLKSAIVARRRNYEFLAFHTYGSTGKLIVEVGVIGFLIGVSIAFFVVVGDLGPALAADFFMIENNSKLRAELLIVLGFFVALPLGMLRKVESLESLSALSIVFYGLLILKSFFEAAPHLVSGSWWYEVEWWRPQGFLPCLPIFSLALSCQTQLFEFFDTMNEPSLKKMDEVVKGAVLLCSIVYILVGLFGYIALFDQPMTGNVLVRFSPTVITDLFKLGFVVSVLVSFPLCLFPCRTSLHSLLYKQSHYEFAGSSSHIPDPRFRNMTGLLVLVTIVTAILVPHIEFVLGMIGSTIGTTVCFILPGIIFLRLTDRNTNERWLAQMVLCIGIFILLACTYSTLEDANKPELPAPVPADLHNPNLAKPPSTQPPPAIKDLPPTPLLQIPRMEEPRPPLPDIPKLPEMKKPELELKPPSPEPIKKEVRLEESLQEKQEDLIKQLAAHQEEQKKILEEQKKVLQELKLHKESHKAISPQPQQQPLPMIPIAVVEEVSEKPQVKPPVVQPQEAKKPEPPPPVVVVTQAPIPPDIVHDAQAIQVQPEVGKMDIKVKPPVLKNVSSHFEAPPKEQNSPPLFPAQPEKLPNIIKENTKEAEPKVVIQPAAMAKDFPVAVPPPDNKNHKPKNHNLPPQTVQGEAAADVNGEKRRNEIRRRLR